MKCIAQPADVLLNERKVEAVLMIERGNRLWRGAWAENRSSRTARQCVQQCEHDHRDDEQHGNRLECAAQQEPTSYIFLFCRNMSLKDLESHQKAMDAGGDDVLTKPIHRSELIMRVRSMMWLKRAITAIFADEVTHLFHALDDDARWRRLCELNVQAQVRTVAATPTLRDAWARGQQVTVHGWIYDLHDGLLQDLGVTMDGQARG